MTTIAISTDTATIIHFQESGDTTPGAWAVGEGDLVGIRVSLDVDADRVGGVVAGSSDSEGQLSVFGEMLYDTCRLCTYTSISIYFRNFGSLILTTY